MNWKKIEEHCRMRGRKTIHSTFYGLLEKIKGDTHNYVRVLDGTIVFVAEEEFEYNAIKEEIDN
jgi:hypothetical protein